MKFIQALCETVTRALGLSTLSPWDQDISQQPVGAHFRVNKIHGQETIQGGAHHTPVVNTRLAQPTHEAHSLFPTKDIFANDPFRAATDDHAAPGGEREASMQGYSLPHSSFSKPDTRLPPGPVFAPPHASPGFVCDYSAMRGWRHAAGSSNRNAWLEKPIMDSDSTGGIFNIFTNYDQYAPRGITRQVNFTLKYSKLWLTLDR